MLTNFLLPEQIVRQNGTGPSIEIDPSSISALTVTLGINRIIEQESLDLSIWSSTDGMNWGDKPLAAFPQKFYCGVYTLLVDLSGRPDVRFLRAQWKLNRWGRGDSTALFGIYLFVEPLEQGLLRAAS